MHKDTILALGYAALCVAIIVIGVVVGVVKFMAFWRIAFG